MEGNRRGEAELPLVMPGNIELTRSNSDARTASLGADENSEDIFPTSENVMPDDESEWTDKKHNLYLRCLEVSFVKQLHQSKRMFAQCSWENQRGISMSQKQLINARSALEQFNVLWNCCSRKINDEVCEPPHMSNGVYDISRTSRLGSPSIDMPEFLKLCSGMKNGKRIIFHGLETPPDEFSLNKLSHEHLLDSSTEGMGQNFSDDGNKKLPNFGSVPKRLKTISADSSTPDQGCFCGDLASICETTTLEQAQASVIA